MYTPHVGVRYVFISNLIASIVTLVLLLPEIVNHRWKFDVPLWKKLIPYSAPMLFVGLAGAVNQHFDKLVTNYLLPEKLALHDWGAQNIFVKQKKEGLQLIAHCEETDKKTLKAVLEPNTDVTLLIGPEGDFSEKEIVLALEQHYIPVTLGTTRLRTETAAVVACHSVVFFNEN